MINFQEVWNEKCAKYGVNKEQISIFPSVRRIIVIGDIHGDYNMMISSLKLAHLIDDNHNWIGNDTYVVQVGDQIDRCRPNGIPCDEQMTPNDEDEDLIILYYLTNLHKKAAKHKGAVISLMGNHELMNVDGNLDYVSRAGVGMFPGKESYFKSKQDRIHQFSRGNELSNFLACTRYIAVIIGSNLFAHAGIIGKIAKEYNIKSINQIMTLFLLNKFNDNNYVYDDISHKKYMLSNNDTSKLFYNSESPLWNRIYGYMGYFYENDGLPQKYKNEEDIKKICAENLDILKDVYQVDKIFVGHTPMLKNGITSVCDGKVWLTDYGSSNAFNLFRTKEHLKRSQVLEILNDGETINILKDTDHNKSYYYKESTLDITIKKY